MPARSLGNVISTNGGQQIAPMDRRLRGEYGRNIGERPRGEIFVLHGLLQSMNLPGAVQRTAQQWMSSDIIQGAVMTDPTREEIREELKDKIASAEARTDTKIERLGGKIDVLTTTIVGKIESLKDDVSNLKDDISKSDQYNHDTRLVLISTFIVGFLALAGLLVAVVTYGDAIFGRGMNVRDVVHAVIAEQQEIQKRDTTQPRH